MRDLPVIDDPWIGNVLDDRFDVLGLLGKGGMGAVYRCRERTSGMQVAVKLILEDWATEEEVQARFEREISASVGIRHPNIIQLLGHGQTVEGTRYFAMELVDGVSLMEHIENEGPLSSEAIAHLGAQVARGLQAAHDAGVVHRDLKPENILVDNTAQAKILDFGLALLQRGSSTPDRLTQLGVRIGSPLYMSPEYCAYGQLDHRSDLYSLGAILYEMATGRPLFSGGAYEVFAQHANSPITPIEERVPGQHPKWLRDAIESLLAKDPDERLQTAAEAAERLTRPPDLSTPVRSITPLVPVRARRCPRPHPHP